MHIPAPLLLFLVFPLPLAAQEKFTLRYRLEPGKTAWSICVTEKAQKPNLAGQDRKSTMTTTLWLESRVTEVRDGVATVEQRYARAKVQSDDPRLQLDYDSDVEGSDPGTGARKMANVVGRTAKGQVDAMGKVHGFTLPDQLGEQDVMNLKGLFQQQFVAWPQDPIAIGDTWQSSMDFPPTKWGPMKATITNKLIAVKGDVVTIQQTTAMDTSNLTVPEGLKMDVSCAVVVVVVSLVNPQPVEWNRTLEMKLVGAADASMKVTMTVGMTIRQVEAPAPKKAADAPKAGDKNDTDFLRLMAEENGGRHIHVD